MGVFTPWKLANTKNHGILPPRKPVVKHLPAHYWVSGLFLLVLIWGLLFRFALFEADANKADLLGFFKTGNETF